MEVPCNSISDFCTITPTCFNICIEIQNYTTYPIKQKLWSKITVFHNHQLLKHLKHYKENASQPCQRMKLALQKMNKELLLLVKED